MCTYKYISEMCISYTHNENHLMFSMIYMIYMMILNVPITQIGFMTIRIQKHLWNNFQLKHQEMEVYIITFHEKHET